MIMDDYRMIISGIIGSVITLICTAIIDYFEEKYKSNVELKDDISASNRCC